MANTAVRPIHKPELANKSVHELIESLLDLNRFDSGAMRMARQSVDVAEVLGERERAHVPLARRGAARGPARALRRTAGSPPATGAPTR